MKHLADSQLALAARGELPLPARLRAQAHCLLCRDCRHSLALYRQDHSRVQQAVAAFTLPRSTSWPALEQEMLANIRLGLEVSALCPPPPVPTPAPAIRWRAGVAVAALTLIVLSGWFLSGPGSRPYLRSLPGPVAMVESGPLRLTGGREGVSVENRGSGFILRHASASARFEVGLEGSVRASVVDQDSGQITVSQIYVE